MLRALLLSFAIFLTTTAASHAALVTTTLTLDPVTPTANTLDLTLLDGATVTELTGTIEARIEIDFATGVISNLELLSGSINATAWNMNVTVPGAGVIPVSSTASTAGATSSAADVVTGTSFTSANHSIVLNSGVVSAAGGQVQDFTAEPLSIPGAAAPVTGTITSTANGADYDIAVTLPIDSVQTFSFMGVQLSLNIAGNVVARGTATAVPEPGSAAMLALLGIPAVLRRRRA